MPKLQTYAGFVLVVAISWATAPASNAGPADSAAPVIEPTVLEEIAHDPEAFTQGLEKAGTTLWEGTGLAGASYLRELDPATGGLRREAPTMPQRGTLRKFWRSCSVGGGSWGL